MDWPHAAVGATWIDLLVMLPSVAMQGGPEPATLFNRHAVAAGADPGAVTAVLCGRTGMFVAHGATFGTSRPAHTARVPDGPGGRGYPVVAAAHRLAMSKIGAVITEHAILEVRPGQEDDFESAFAQAKTIIAAAPGFVSLDFHRGIETPRRYLLIVGWETLEDHTEGFRKSDAYQEWRTLLHHFYEPMPTVEHFSLIATA